MAGQADMEISVEKVAV